MGTRGNAEHNKLKSNSSYFDSRTSNDSAHFKKYLGHARHRAGDADKTSTLSDHNDFTRQENDHLP